MEQLNQARMAKKEQVDSLKSELEGIQTVFLCNFQGLTVGKDNQLRRKIREKSAEYVVVKNSLLRLAFEGTPFQQIDEHLIGNTAIAYTKQDIVGLAKLIADFSKENEKFSFKAGVVEGKVISLKDLDAVANLPSKEVLVSKLMFVLNYPIQGLVTALSGITRNLVVTLDQIRQQKEQ